MKALVIGMGSIGQRHSRLLAQKKFKVEVLSRSYAANDYRSYRSMDQISDWSVYQLVLITNETSKHGDTLKEIRQSGFKGTVLMEKPIFSASRFAEDQTLGLDQVYVSYQLRFHPMLQEIKNLIAGKNIHSLSLRVGQHLSTWRSNRPWKESYSALREQGGGVLRDLSHEIDYAQWLLGDIAKVSGMIKKTSELGIDAEDIVAFFGVFQSETVLNIEMNYLDRIPSRQIHLLGDGFHIKGDMISGELEYKDDKNHWKKAFPIDRDLLFNLLYDDLLGEKKELCSSKDALKVLKVCEAVEQSWEGQKWQKV